MSTTDYCKAPPGPPPQNHAYMMPPQPSYAPNYSGRSYQQHHPPPPPLSPTQKGHENGYHRNNGQQQMGQMGYSDPPPPYTTFEQQFAIPKPKYNDLWAAILFLATFLGLIVVGVVSLRGYALTRRTNGNGIYDDRGNTFGLSTNTMVLFGFVLGVAAVVGFAYFMLARKFTKQLIYITAIANIAIGLGTAIYYLYRRYYSAGLVFLLFALFYAFCFWTWRSRIPFSVLMLETAIDVARHFGHVFVVSAVGGLIALMTGAWFALTFVAVYVKYTPDRDNPACGVGGGGCSKSKLVGLLVFTVFGFYWLSEVIKNVMHTSVSGVYGSWYFCSKHQMPRHPTLGALKRAMTYSFGSICFGSLLVSIIQLIKQALSIARQDSMSEGNIVGTILFCCAECIMGLIQWLVEFFNHYAYSYIALYGDAFIPAAKQTWKMMKDRGIDALINDCLVDPVLTAGSIFVGYLCALLAYLYLQFTNPLYNRDGDFTPVVLAFSFLIGLQVANIFLVPIKSGIATIFTSMAHSPEVMIRDHGDLYRRVVAVYPRVQEHIHA